jgi:hypothetical protein
MRHLSILGGVLAITSLSLLFSSCEKTIDTQYSDRQETGIFAGNDCKGCAGEYIGFYSGNSTLDPLCPPPLAESPFFFWRGDKYARPNHDVAINCKQPFFHTDFSDQQIFVVTATGGYPILNCHNGALGVNDGYIDVGESISLELSKCLNGRWIDAFNLVLTGTKASRGVIELYHAAKLVQTIEFCKETCHPFPEMIEDRAQNFPVIWTFESNNVRFNKMVIRPTVGRYNWIGFHRNLNPNDPDGPYPHFEPNWWHLNKEK